MACVLVLEDKVVNQIAAGEVVERPASVVKELVENALDAGATEIRVSIANGGKSEIEVSDNGLGMVRADAVLSVERFATSKISIAEDLNSISTFGFRGEALSSIASVSDFSLNTNPCLPSDDGTSLFISGGSLVNLENCARSRGTTVKVSRLFHNVPARRKFLRSDNTENAVVRTLLCDFAMGNPNVGFQLLIDGKSQFNHAPAPSFFSRANLSLTPSSLASGEQFLSADYFLQLDDDKELRVSAALSQPSTTVKTSNKLRLLVNGRIVRDRLLLSAVRAGYGSMLKDGSSPIGVVRLDLPPEEVDVNVHPQKTEVRFRNSSLVFTSVRQAVQQMLNRQVRPMPYPAEPVICEVREHGSSLSHWSHPAQISGSSYQEHKAGSTESVIDNALPRFKATQVEFLHYQANPEHCAQSELEELLSCRYIGQLLECYLLLEGKESFFIVDMHAAHERVVFHKIRSELLSSGRLSAQILLIPEVVDLSSSEGDFFVQAKSILDRYGFLFDDFGEGSIVLRSVPSLLGQLDPKIVLRELLALPEYSDWAIELEKRLEEKISRLACHGSIRSGRAVQREEVYSLLEDLQKADNADYCPHGRPVKKRFSPREIELLFARTK